MRILGRFFGADDSASPDATDIIQQTEDGIILRRMRWETDAKAVCAFQDDVYSTNFPDFTMTRGFRLGFEHDLRKATNDPDHGVFVLADRDRIVGFLWIVLCESAWSDTRYGYVNNVYIAPSHRRRNLGRLLTDHTDQFLRERGVSRVRLTVTSSNEAAVHLYQRAGYQIERYEMTKWVPEPEDGEHLPQESV